MGEWLRHGRLAIGGVIVAVGASVAGHDLARSESRLEVTGSEVHSTLTIDLLEFPNVDLDGNGSISYAELDRAIADIFALVKQHLQLRAAGEPDRVVLTRHELIDEHTARLELSYTFPAAVSRLAVTSTIDQLARRPDHQHVVVVQMSGEEERSVLDVNHRTATFERRWWSGWALWLTLGALAVIGIRVAWFLHGRSRQGRI